MPNARAYSFESDLKFHGAVKRFDAIEDWVRKPNLDGKWLVRDNDRHGDYLSYSAYDEADRNIVKSVSIFFDTTPKQITLSISSGRKTLFSALKLARAWKRHQSWVLDTLLPSIGARDIQPSDFER
jgi:hypothetical protein